MDPLSSFDIKQFQLGAIVPNEHSIDSMKAEIRKGGEEPSESPQAMARQVLVLRGDPNPDLI